MLRDVRDSLAPDARIMAETDLSIPRALHRVVRRDHRDLLVVGSSRNASEGRVRIGKRTRQLLCHFECALAISPRGLQTQPSFGMTALGPGQDDVDRQLEQLGAKSAVDEEYAKLKAELGPGDARSEIATARQAPIAERDPTAEPSDER